ncbi:MAG: caspase family protein [Pseudomonadota bacterium]
MRNAPRTVAALLWALMAAFIGLAGPVPAQEARSLKGVALIVGQSGYAHVTPLANPTRDARAVDGLLTALGFDTRTVTDRDSDMLKRDIDRFVEDAEDADVALLYYSGHGIEAGGENYLIPTDADLASLSDAGERLVPLSGIVNRLKRSVPVTILLLDACRTNPFPPEATLRTAGNTKTAPIGAIGLGAPRGMSAVDEPAPSDNLGIVIGLAAEPGSAALDGDPGGNSPYAAALLRHLSAIKGEEFGTVMRMVTEEVYLSTGTRQRPWINESLRRLLYFGGTPQEADGVSGLITTERRRLLLTITDLAQAERKQLETVAAKDGVPLDALYGVLRALGASDIPKDPAAFEKYLRAQAETLKKMMMERDALRTDDPEIIRLARAADEAIWQGAIATARDFLDEAVKIVEQNRISVDAAEARVRERRISDAAVYAWRAETARLAFDYPAAAKDYETAYDLISKWDDARAWRYKFEIGNVLSEQGDTRGDTTSLRRAITAYEAALTLADRAKAPKDWAKTQNNLGITLGALGDRESGSDNLLRAVKAYQAALEVFTREASLPDWGMTHNNLGGVLLSLGEREAGTTKLKEAVAAYRAAGEAFQNPLDRASALSNLGSALRQLGERESGTERLQEAVAAYHAALASQKREDAPLLWGLRQSNLGIALRTIGDRETGTRTLEEAITTYRLALEELTVDLAPVDWARTQSNLGNALAALGQRESNLRRFQEAVTAYRLALDHRARENAPALWALTQNNLGGALTLIGQNGGGALYLEEAVAAYRHALEERTREAMPYQWGLTQSNLGAALQALGEERNDTGLLAQAVAAHRLALLEMSRDRLPQEWSKVQNNLGNALRSLGERETGTRSLEAALAALRASLEERSRAQSPHQWARTQVNIGLTLLALAQRGAGGTAADQAISAFDDALSVYEAANATQDIAKVQGFLAEAQALR